MASELIHTHTHGTHWSVSFFVMWFEGTKNMLFISFKVSRVHIEKCFKNCTYIKMIPFWLELCEDDESTQFTQIAFLNLQKHTHHTQQYYIHVCRMHTRGDDATQHSNKINTFFSTTKANNNMQSEIAWSLSLFIPSKNRKKLLYNDNRQNWIRICVNGLWYVNNYIFSLMCIAYCTISVRKEPVFLFFLTPEWNCIESITKVAQKFIKLKIY